MGCGVAAAHREVFDGMFPWAETPYIVCLVMNLPRAELAVELELAAPRVEVLSAANGGERTVKGSDEDSRKAATRAFERQ